MLQNIFWIGMSLNASICMDSEQSNQDLDQNIGKAVQQAEAQLKQKTEPMTEDQILKLMLDDHYPLYQSQFELLQAEVASSPQLQRALLDASMVLRNDSEKTRAMRLLLTSSQDGRHLVLNALSKPEDFVSVQPASEEVENKSTVERIIISRKTDKTATLIRPDTPSKPDQMRNLFTTASRQLQSLEPNWAVEAPEDLRLAQESLAQHYESDPSSKEAWDIIYSLSQQKSFQDTDLFRRALIHSIDSNNSTMANISMRAMLTNQNEFNGFLNSFFNEDPKVLAGHFAPDTANESQESAASRLSLIQKLQKTFEDRFMGKLSEDLQKLQKKPENNLDSGIKINLTVPSNQDPFKLDFDR